MLIENFNYMFKLIMRLNKFIIFPWQCCLYQAALIINLYTLFDYESLIIHNQTMCIEQRQLEFCDE